MFHAFTVVILGCRAMLLTQPAHPGTNMGLAGTSEAQGGYLACATPYEPHGIMDT